MDLEKLVSALDRRLIALSPRGTAELRTFRRQISREVRGRPARFVVSLALRLMAGHDIGRRFVASELIAHHPAALASLRSADLRRLAGRLDNWAAVDIFAVYLAGPAWRNHQVPESLIHRWARSADRWWRRAALVCTVPLNQRSQGGAGDARRTLRVCRMLVSDRDDMAVKAMSWALRALAVRDSTAVRRFLDREHRRLAARVRREVAHKLETGRKSGSRIDVTPKIAEAGHNDALIGIARVAPGAGLCPRSGP